MKYSRPHIEINFQEGPIKEVGQNGCQLPDVLNLCFEELDRLNKIVPSKENNHALTNLRRSITYLNQRTADREARGVEGYKKP